MRDFLVQDVLQEAMGLRDGQTNSSGDHSICVPTGSTSLSIAGRVRHGIFPATAPSPSPVRSSGSACVFVFRSFPHVPLHPGLRQSDSMCVFLFPSLSMFIDPEAPCIAVGAAVASEDQRRGRIAHEEGRDPSTLSRKLQLSDLYSCSVLVRCLKDSAHRIQKAVPWTL